LCNFVLGLVYWFNWVLVCFGSEAGVVYPASVVVVAFVALLLLLLWLFVRVIS
jgi:hypothetical protein